MAYVVDKTDKTLSEDQFYKFSAIMYVLCTYLVLEQVCGQQLNKMLIDLKIIKYFLLISTLTF